MISPFLFLQAIDTLKEAQASSLQLTRCQERLDSPEVFPNAPSIPYYKVSFEDLTSPLVGVDTILDNLEQTGDDCLLAIVVGCPFVSEAVRSLVMAYNLAIAHSAYAIALSKKRRRVASTNQQIKASKILKKCAQTLRKHLLPTAVDKNVSESTQLYQVRALLFVTLLRLYQNSDEMDNEDSVYHELVEVHESLSMVADVVEVRKTTRKLPGRCRSFNATSA